MVLLSWLYLQASHKKDIAIWLDQYPIYPVMNGKTILCQLAQCLP